MTHRIFDGTIQDSVEEGWLYGVLLCRQASTLVTATDFFQAVRRILRDGGPRDGAGAKVSRSPASGKHRR